MTPRPPEPELNPDLSFTQAHINQMRAYLADLADHQCRHPLDHPDPQCPVCELHDDTALTERERLRVDDWAAVQ